ncbi:hypothetical protein SAMN04488122_1843 [Chitinophaga arvensicola]|uniref:Uncharacterized protein n=1 Tax=Chitinophaga arvensicola TaxID=29529 RepID=A0A1I0QXE4_9BACT|nr:hypothetical protein SAMN04488122_1843 [Chitinophaga arvensicola]
MSLTYYVSKIQQSTGEHEVHDETCSVLPRPENRIELGKFSGCWPAVSAARKIYLTADGCKICSAGCHTR